MHPDLLSEVQVQRIKDEAQGRLDAEVARAREAGLEFTESHMRFGRADGETIKLAEEIGADLIVIGNRSGDPMSRILLGNDAESIVRHAPLRRPRRAGARGTVAAARRCQSATAGGAASNARSARLRPASCIVR